jgi:zinc transport system substrate-binding protein
VRYFLYIAFAIFSFSARAEEAKVVATIKPLHSLVAAVMEGSGDSPMLLVDGKTSPHTFLLKPSQVNALQHARIVFYMGDGFELFLRNVWPSLPPSVNRVPMDQTPNLMRYTTRLGKDFDLHVHEEESHSEGAYDLHLWMMADNAKAMVMEIAQQLAIVFPKKREIYFDNARRLNERIKQQHIDLGPRMAMLRGKPFIVFHDAFQYFEKDYGLNCAGSIMMHPEEMPGAKHISEIRKKITELKAKCVFREPSFDAKMVDNLLEGTSAKSSMLDPEGALLAPGPELYFQSMEGIASALEKCLGNP